MKKKLTNNWLLKIGSLLFAFGLWLVIININDPSDTKPFSNITIKYLNTETITDQGMVYELIEGSNVLRSVTISAPRSILEQLDKSDIVAEANFEEMDEDGVVPINLYTNRYNNKINTIRASSSNLKFNIEEEGTVRLILNVNPIGEVAEGYILGNITTDQNRVVVTGPQSITSQITKAVVDVDVNDSSVTIATNASIKLYDQEDQLIESASLVSNISEVRVSVEILATKTVPITYSTTGIPATGYAATGVIDSNPSTVVVAGTSTNLSNINKIEIPAEVLNITGQSSDMNVLINIREYLPSNVSIVDNTYNGNATVTVYIEECVNKTFSMRYNTIQFTNLPEGYTAEIVGDDESALLEFSGLAKDIDALSAQSIIGYVDIEDIMSAEEMETLEEDTYSANVEFQFNNSITVNDEVRVRVRIEKNE